MWIDNNSISDLSPLVANTGLRSGDTVDVDNNPLNHASINSHIPTLRSRGVIVELQSIVAQPNAVDIPDPNLRNAIEQTLGKARGAAITADEMARLNILNTPNRNIRNLTGLEHAINLTELGLNQNDITDISPLAGLTKLIALGLGDNNITDISPLAGLTNLIGLGLGDNNITNISPLTRLTRLEILWLPDNSISDLSPLVANTGLGNGDEVSVEGNPLSDRSINTHIPTLQRRGVTVHFDQIVVPPQTVNIPDSNLRNAIEQILRKARGATITVADMERLDAVYATSENIHNLTGLEHATNLTELRLTDNVISNISPLARLTNLTELDLADNSISNISPLAGLTNLTVLRLDDNSISDISPLSGLTRLSELYLKNNKISNLWPLVINRGLSSGDKVDVNGNPLSDISFDSYIPTLQSRAVTVEYNLLKSPTNIPDPNIRNAIGRALNKPRDEPIREEDMARLTELEITHKTITNLTGLELAINLRKLNLRNNAIRDISPLAGLTHLTELNLRKNILSDISPLAGLTQLEKLYLENNTISDVSPLTGLTRLSELYLESNKISDISPLINNTGLGNGDHVNVKRNPLSDVSIKIFIPALQSRGVTVESDIVVAQVNIPDPNLRNAIERALGKARGATITADEMERLTQLDAKNKNITNLTGLESATNLRNLKLQENAISDISPIAGLTQMVYLYLRDNSISDISPLSRLTQLIVLHLGGNRISNISSLAGLTNLAGLGLGRNNITDISPLSRLTQLTSLGLHSNSISNISSYRKIN